MKAVEVDGFSFRFEDAIDAFVFDEKDVTKATFHGAPMKAVDIITEFANCYVYIEMKDYDDPSVYDIRSAMSDDEQIKRKKRFNWLKDYLKYKFRDSYLYRHAEQKVDKPIHYICLNNFDSGLNFLIQKSLRLELPVGKPSDRWIQSLVVSCHVVNFERWEKLFPKWEISCLTSISN
ncbi:MAG: hypothetical protein OXF73_00680 [Gammaproteobacteria bacterium]|nr:hypothetical protein [Gammaproteobacteria bacterium]